MRMKSWLVSVVALAACASILLGATGANAASEQGAGLPGNIGNLDDGGPVDVQDLLGMKDFSPDWIPTPSELLTADCAASADQAGLIERNGLVLIRGWGHWQCNQSLPGNYLEVCLDLGFPSVNCNEKLKLRPTSSISLAVDFICAPGAWITMAQGSNPFDLNRANDTAHSDYALLVLPQDCQYLNTGSEPRLVPIDEVPPGMPIRVLG